jgi:predicted Holliday junction resolvase-like endonuclease
VFIEVKTGRSGRSAREKALRKAIEETKGELALFLFGALCA